MAERIQGYYSVIQYCPCDARDERMNIGVVLLVESRRYMKTAFLAGSQYRDIAGRFPRDKTPWEIIEESAIVTALRLERISARVADGKGGTGLYSFAEYQTAGPIRVLRPRSVVVDEDLDVRLRRLFKELVEVGQ